MEVGVRVGVRLSRFFCDERAAALIYVSRPLRLVKHLQDRLRRLFQLRGPFCLVKDGFLLPSTEDLALLSQDDVITVVPLVSDFNFDYEECESVEPETVDIIIEKDSKKKKRKKQKELSEDIKKIDKENQSPIVTPERVPKKKHSPFDNPEVTSAIENIEKLHAELMKPVEDDEVENLKTKALTMLKELAPPSTVGVSDGRITKRKRVRIRKNLKNNPSIVTSLSDGESGTNRNNGLVLLNGKVNSHIRFPPPENSTVTVIRNKCNIEDNKPRIVQAIEPSVPTECVVAEAVNIVQENNINDYSIDHILKTIDKFPTTNTFPKKDDVILFKMLKMNENYNPVVSGPILGKVFSTCPDSSLVRFSILDGRNECVTPIGKFDLEEDENASSIESSDFDIIWNQVIEPRAIR